MMARPVLTKLVCALLVVSACAFAAGVALERSRPGEAVTASTEGGHAVETSTGGEQTVVASTASEQTTTEPTGSESTGSGLTTAEGGAETTVTETTGKHVEAVGHSEGGESLLGIKTESTSLVVVAVLLSFGLALLIWFRGSLLVLGSAAAVGLVFAAFDVREALHQSDRSDSTLVAVALVVAMLHLGVVAAAGGALRERRVTVAP